MFYSLKSLFVHIYSIFLFITQSRFRGASTRIHISMRGNHFGPCSVEVFQLAIESGVQVDLGVPSPTEFETLNVKFLSNYESKQFRILKQGSIESFRSVLIAATHVAFENVFETVFGCTLCRLGMKKNIIKVPDGVVTKTQGNIVKSRETPRFPKAWFTSPRSAHVTYAHQSGIDIYRVAVNCQVPSATLMRCVGMPRFGRAEAISNGKRKPVVSPKLLEHLRERKKNVLVALTKNYFNDDLEWFCHQLDCDVKQLNQALETLGVNLWFKEHQSKFDYRKTIGINTPNFSNIKFIHPEDCFSSVDLSPYFDLLLTDISSIYIDLLIADIPIGFINYDSWKHSGSFCYPYEYFYPGKKINEYADLECFFEDFFDKGMDDYAHARGVARTMYLGDGINKYYWERVIRGVYMNSINDMENFKS